MGKFPFNDYPKTFLHVLSLLWFWKSIEIHGFYNLFRWQNMIIQERPMRRSMSTIWSYTSRVRHYKRPRGKGQDMNLARWTWQHLGGGKSTVKALDWGDHGTTLLRRNEHCVQTLWLPPDKLIFIAYFAFLSNTIICL